MIMRVYTYIMHIYIYWSCLDSELFTSSIFDLSLLDCQGEMAHIRTII